MAMCETYKLVCEFYHNYKINSDFRDFCKVHKIMHKNEKGELVANSRDIQRVVGYWLKKNNTWFVK